MTQSDEMCASIITTRDVLGKYQVRKWWSSPVQQDVDMTAAPENPDAEMTAANDSSDEELAMELRTCRQCDSKMKIRECRCEASLPYKEFGRQLISKKSSSWPQLLQDLTGFVTVKRQRLENLKNEEGEKQSSSPEVGSAAQPSHGAGAMPQTDKVDEQSRKPRAKAAPRTRLSAIVQDQRGFDTAEDGQKYSQKGPSTPVAFEHACNQAQ